MKLVELNEATPFVVVVASTPAIVSVPPNDTGEPETDIPVPAVGVTVIDELASCPFVIPAVAERFEVVKPEIAVLVTAVTLPCASVVNTGMFKALPKVPAVPVFGKDKVVVPPSETKPPPVNPVPAVTVKDELAKAALAIEFAGNVTEPDETVSPLLAVNNPAEVIVPVPVVEIFPVVEIVILEARSLPLTEAKVGKPAAFPCNTVVVVPAKVPKTPPEVFVTTPFVERPVSVTDDPVKEVNVPAAAVPPPIAPGAAKVAPPKVDALIVPVPVKFKDAPLPTTIAAMVLVPLVSEENAAEDAVTFEHFHVDVPLSQAKT